MNDKVVIEIEDLCRMLDVGKNTAYAHLSNGDIDAFKIGTVWKIPIASVNRYIHSKCNEHRGKVDMCKIIR